MVKRIIGLAIMAAVLSTNINAQKVAVIDISGILEALPEYESAEKQLDKIAAEWRQDISLEYDKIKSLYNKYQAEQVLLSDDVKQQREDEILEMEKRVREMQKQKFGPDGELFSRRQELITPIQENVFSAIEEYAAERGYDIVLDKGGNSGVLFTSDEYDKTDIIKKQLGIR